jgi:hypothetical protein
MRAAGFVTVGLATFMSRLRQADSDTMSVQRNGCTDESCGKPIKFSGPTASFREQTTESTSAGLKWLMMTTSKAMKQKQKQCTLNHQPTKWMYLAATEIASLATGTSSRNPSSSFTFVNSNSYCKNIVSIKTILRVAHKVTK